VTLEDAVAPGHHFSPAEGAGTDERGPGWRETAAAEIAALVRRDGAQAAYYAALDVQHFGNRPSASNFLDFACVEEALMACFVARGGLHGDDRDVLLSMGTEEKALLEGDVCRYLVFPARGCLGVMAIADLEGDVLVELICEKPGVPLALMIVRSQLSDMQFERPEVGVATAIIGHEGGLWTVHPGLPTRPRVEPLFERAGFDEGVIFRVADLVDPATSGGREIRRIFEQHDIEFPTIRSVKVPAIL
jgi:hypothetical protein